MAQAKLFGSSIKRREDPRMITGKGVYTDDVRLPGQTYAVFVRSPHAHARVRRVDLSRAKGVAGVVATYSSMADSTSKARSLMSLATSAL